MDDKVKTLLHLDARISKEDSDDSIELLFEAQSSSTEAESINTFFKESEERGGLLFFLVTEGMSLPWADTKVTVSDLI